LLLGRLTHVHPPSPPPKTAKNGVVIATEKKMQSTLIDDATLDKVANLTQGIGAVYSGLGPDSRVLVNKARKSAQKYRAVYNEYPPTKILVSEIANVMQEFTQVYFLVGDPQNDCGLLVGWCATFRRVAAHRRLRRGGTCALPGRSLWVILWMEGHGHRQEHDQREDLP